MIRKSRRRRTGPARYWQRLLRRQPLLYLRMTMLGAAILVPALLLGCPSRPTTPSDTPRPTLPLPRHSTIITPPVATPPPPVGPRLAEIPADPVVRVRIGTGSRTVELGERQSLIVGPPQRADMALTFTGPITITRQADTFTITPAQGQAMQWQVSSLFVRTATGSTIKVGASQYPGLVYLHARDVPVGELPMFDVINHARMDDYLPGVLTKELYANWHPTTFHAQAIAARSYALHERWRNQNKHFDMESGTASQAYVGLASNAKARDAVRDTAGQALTYGGHVFAAYYSSSTGGTGQDAAIAFPRGAAIEPLRGRDQGNWEVGTPHYRWGPITRDRAALARRIAAWGAANWHAVAGLKDIAAISVTSTNAAGRPGGFRLTTSSGTTFDLSAEQFRFACNYQADNLPALQSGSALKSSHVTIRVTEGHVIFVEGRGYGHGVGMSQYGAQSMALRGHTAEQILDFYYPGADIRKVY